MSQPETVRIKAGDFSFEARLEWELAPQTCAAFARHRSKLAAIERRYGVDAHIVAAIWGLESFYGERRGNIPVVSSTSTLAYDGRRGSCRRPSIGVAGANHQGHKNQQQHTVASPRASRHGQIPPGR